MSISFFSFICIPRVVKYSTLKTSVFLMKLVCHIPAVSKLHNVELIIIVHLGSMCIDVVWLTLPTNLSPQECITK